MDAEQPEPAAISIHALREEGDPQYPRLCAKIAYFYPRPPRGGRRMPNITGPELEEFLSTPSARRATLIDESEVPVDAISIHALREEGDIGECAPAEPVAISIHALREEGDLGEGTGKIPTLISIHALREEGDALYNNKGQLNNDFYPRPPRGGRQRGCGEPQGSNQFLSTPSARRATPIFSTRLS